MLCFTWKYKDFVYVLGLCPRLVIIFLYLFYCALMYVLLYINVHTTSPLVIVTANHISAPPGFPHPAALGIRIVRLPIAIGLADDSYRPTGRGRRCVGRATPAQAKLTSAALQPCCNWKKVGINSVFYIKLTWVVTVLNDDSLYSPKYTIGSKQIEKQKLN